MQELFDGVSQLGFPIVVTMYCLIRMENTIHKTTEKQNKAIKELTVVITTLIEKIERR